jgi:hypothetical protein
MKRILSALLIALMLLPSHAAASEGAQKGNNGLFAVAKSDYSFDELKTLFPDAEISAQKDKQIIAKVALGILPDAATKGKQPIQRFTHEFPDGSRTYLDVYQDGSRGSYGYTLGKKTTNGSVATYTNTSVYWKNPMGIIIGIIVPIADWKYKVTHTKNEATAKAAIVSKSLVSCWGENYAWGTYGSGSSYAIIHKADLYVSTDTDDGTMPLCLQFDLYNFGVTAYPR